MVEVFKTNVSKQQQANLLISLIERTFTAYRASFDLEDCDRILRISSANGEVRVNALVRLMQNFGYHAEVLTDELHDIPALLEMS